MNREGVTAIIIALTLLALAAMAFGWWRRRRRDGGLAAPVAEAPTSAPIARFAGLYVATTRHSLPLDRLAVKHLAFRSKVQVAVHPEGIALEIPGEPPLFFARETLRGAGLATWTIDRVVERDGLALFAWQVDEATIADSYVRLREPDDTAPAAFVAAVEALTPEALPAEASGPEASTSEASVPASSHTAPAPAATQKDPHA